MPSDEQHPAATAVRSPESQWFWDHYDFAANEIIDFFGAEGISLENKVLADIGCGDGIMDYGLCAKARPAHLLGYDVNPVDTDKLLARTAAEGVGSELPPQIEFQTSAPEAIPCENDAIDYAFSWSAFEHIAEPVSILREVRRILKPDGVFMLQLWPFYHSERGSHLWDWFPAGHHHLLEHDIDTVEKMSASDTHEAGWTAYMADEFKHLNRITLDELQRCVIASGLEIRRFELLTSPVQLVPALARYPLSALGIGGVKLLASQAHI